MAIVKKIKLNHEDGTSELHDIGVKAENVALSNGKDLEIELNNKVTQTFTQDDNFDETLQVTIVKDYLKIGNTPFVPKTKASQVIKEDGSQLEVNGKLTIDENGMKIWTFQVLASNWVDNTDKDNTSAYLPGLKKNTIIADGITGGTFLTSFQLDSAYALNKEAKAASELWKYCDTQYNKVVFYTDDEITADFVLTAIEVDKDNSKDHNEIFRGEDLLSLSHFENLDNLYAALRAGDFSDIYIGDYIGSDYFVAGIDFYNGTAVEPGLHHLVIIPTRTLGAAAMDTYNLNAEAGYLGSEMVTTLYNDPSCLPAMENKFGIEHIYSGAWTVTIDNMGNTEYTALPIRLLNEMAVFGNNELSPNDPLGEMDKQLPFFKLNSAIYVPEGYFWLSSIGTVNLGEQRSDFVAAFVLEDWNTGPAIENSELISPSIELGILPMIILVG